MSLDYLPWRSQIDLLLPSLLIKVPKVQKNVFARNTPALHLSSTDEVVVSKGLAGVTSLILMRKIFRESAKNNECSSVLQIFNGIN